MKKNIFACIVLCLLLAGCATDPKPVHTEAPVVTMGNLPGSSAETTAEETAPPAPVGPVGLTEVADLTVAENEMVCCLQCREDIGAVLLEAWSETEQRPERRVCLIDMLTGRLIRSQALEPCDLSGVDRLELTEDGMLLIDSGVEQAAIYDTEGGCLGDRDYPVMDRDNLGRRNPVLDATFFKDDAYAEFEDTDIPDSPAVYLAFYDRNDGVYCLPERIGSVVACRGHRLLVSQYDEDSHGLELRWMDLDAGQVTDRCKLEEDREDWYLNICAGGMNDRCALLALERSSEVSETSICVWYPEPGRETPLEVSFVTQEALARETEELKQELEADYGLTIRLDEAPAADITPTLGLDLDYGQNLCDTGASVFGQRRILRGLKQFLGGLPQGLVPEIYGRMPGSDPWNRDTLYVYIVRNIPGDSAAFANAWNEEMSVCFATEEYNASHLPHEFMHLMDYRIEQYMFSVDRNWDVEWWDLSPDYAYDTELTDEQSDEVWDYFVSSYARTNSDEDRAETFERLYNSEEPLEEAWWFKEYPHVQEKVRVLIQGLREAFPSVQATDRATWEKLP